MNILLVLGFLSCLAIYETSAKCCGHGKLGYCNDCSKVGAINHRKCCGTGSGHGHGCNVFCCACSCRKGHATFVKLSGWWLSAKYRCTTKTAEGDEDKIHIEEMKDTWETFNSIDDDGDMVINPGEFLKAIKNRLSHNEAHLLASDLLKSNDKGEILSFIDAINDEELMEDADKDVENNLGSIIAREFNMMDDNGDGLIQAAEFDHDLE
uniref:uncharacterized protein LOC120348299 n=1 Tax=Styela clava TaxID=7725 RepID=UPI001939D804|nr:uncharacterized protein LOC120348299 [Styela clava]